MSTPPPFGGGVFIADKSAWARARNTVVQGDWAQALDGGQIATCCVNRIELLFSARDAQDFQALREELDTLMNVEITDAICEVAVGALSALATHSPLYHRVMPPDVLIAASAQAAQIGVLHYDRHFDRLAEVLTFESRWIAPAGSIP